MKKRMGESRTVFDPRIKQIDARGYILLRVVRSCLVPPGQSYASPGLSGRPQLLEDQRGVDTMWVCELQRA